MFVMDGKMFHVPNVTTTEYLYTRWQEKRDDRSRCKAENRGSPELLRLKQVGQSSKPQYVDHDEVGRVEWNPFVLKGEHPTVMPTFAKPALYGSA